MTVESLAEKFGYIKEQGKTILNFSGNFGLVVKIFLGTVAGNLIGANALGFLSELAAYNYSYHYGVRFPFEGVPYLKSYVTYGTFLVAACLILVFIIIYFSSEKLLKLSFKAVEDNETTNEENKFMNFIRNLVAIAPTTLLAGFLILASIYIAFYESLGLAEQNGRYLPFISIARYDLAITMMLAILVTHFNKIKVWWLAIISISISYVLGIVFLFTPYYYGNLLRITGYGGCIPVQIQLNDEFKLDKQATNNLSLFLKTNDVLIVLDQEQNMIQELKISNIRSIEYKPQAGLNHSCNLLISDS